MSVLGTVVIGGAHAPAGASLTETAAIMAAVSAFLRDTAPAGPRTAQPAVSDWLVAARSEALRGELASPQRWHATK